jgi:autotransporter-associated beta strand protein
LLALRSAIPGTPWSVNPSGSRIVAFVDVQDSTDTSPTPFLALSSKDSGDNTGWTFGPAVSWTGTVSSNWGDPGNWSADYVPGFADAVIIPGGATNQPILDTARTVYNLTLQSGAILTLAGSNLTATGKFNNKGTMVLEGNETVSLAMGNDAMEGTWRFVGTGTSGMLNVPSFGSNTIYNYYNLTIADTRGSPGLSTFQLPPGISVGNILAISGGTVNAGSAITVTVGGTLAVSGGTFNAGTSTIITAGNVVLSGGTFNAPSAAGHFNISDNWSNTGATFNADGGTVMLLGGSQSISGNTIFYGLSKTVAANSTLIFAAGSTQTVTGPLTLAGAVSNELVLRSSAPGATWNINPSGSRAVRFVDVQDSDNLSPTAVNAPLSRDAGNNTNWNITNTLTWIGAVSNSWDNPANWDVLIVPGSTNDVLIPGGTPNQPTLSAPHAVENMMIESGATLFVNGNSLTVSGTFINQGTVELYGTSPVNLASGNDKTEGTWVYLGDGVHNLAELSVYGYYNLVIDDVHPSAAAFVFRNPLTVNGSLTVIGGSFSPLGATVTMTVGNVFLMGGILLDPYGGINATGDWNETGGVFNAGLATVHFTGGNQTITGSTTFYGLTKTVTSAATLTIAGGSTQTVKGPLTLIGAQDQPLALRSLVTGTPWLIDASGPRAVAYVDVQDSLNASPEALVDIAGKDSGNNTNWTFSNNVALFTTGFPNGAIGSAYRQTISAAGGMGPLTFSSTGTLPPGVMLSSGGVLGGTPTAVGSYSFTITASDTTGMTTSENYTLVVMPAITFATGGLSSWTVNSVNYYQSISATGGTGSLTFSMIGSLPPGLTLSRSGILSGTPTVTGTYAFTVLATDTVGASGSQNYVIVINPLPSIATSILSDGTAGASYHQTISTSGGTAPFAFYESSINLVVNGDFEAGNTGFASQYTYSPGNLLPEGDYDVVTNPSQDSIYATSFGDHTTGHGRMLMLNGATAPNMPVWTETITVVPGKDYVFSLWDASWYPLSPANLAIEFNTVNGGTVTATTAPLAAGVWQQFTTTWNSGSATSVTISINDTNLAASGNDFALDDIALLGSGPITALPPGLTLSTSGVLSGTPTAVGNYNFGVTAIDAAGSSANQTYAMVINPAVTITTVSLANGTAGQAGYSQTVNALGGTGTLTFSERGALPPGLSLSTTGTLTGLPTQAGSYTFTVTAIDSVGATASKSYTVGIAPPTVAYVDPTFTGSGDPLTDPGLGLIVGANAFPTISAGLANVAPGGTLVLFGGTYTEPIVDFNVPLAAVDIASNPSDPTIMATVTLVGAITLANDTTFDLAGVPTGTGVSSAANLTFGSTLDGTGAMTINGNGALTFNGPVGTVVNVLGGQLNPTATFTLAGSGSLAIGTGLSETIGALASTSSIANVQLDSGSNMTTGGSGSSSFAGTIRGPGQLTKVGMTTFALSGDDTYTGPTFINAGTLTVNGILETAPSP